MSETEHPDSIGRRLLSARGKVSQSEFAASIGVHRNTLAKYESDEWPLPLDAYDALLRLGINPNWVRTGEGTVRAGPINVDSKGNVLIDVPAPQPQTLGSDWVMVKRYRVDLAAGTGKLAGDHISVDELAFRRQYLEFLGVSTNNAAIVRVRGDSMEPALRDGDTVMIDTTDTTIQPPARDQSRRRAYAICHTGPGGEALRCKFVELVRANGAEFTQIASCNPDFPPERVESDEIQVLGRIRWAGRTWF